MATTITNLAQVSKAGYDPGNPLFLFVVEFDLKADYDPAAPLVVSTAFKAAIGVGRTILGVVPISMKGLTPQYVSTDDTVHFYWQDCDGVSDGPLIEVAAADMAAYTDLRMGILAQ